MTKNEAAAYLLQLQLEGLAVTVNGSHVEVDGDIAEYAVAAYWYALDRDWTHDGIGVSRTRGVKVA